MAILMRQGLFPEYCSSACQRHGFRYFKRDAIKMLQACLTLVAVNGMVFQFLKRYKGMAQ
jgi:hypothetical protein